MIIWIIRAVRGDRSAAIGNISRALGYSESYMRSLYAFSRSFRNHCTMSPSEYRRAVRLTPRAGESKRFVQAAPK